MSDTELGSVQQAIELRREDLVSRIGQLRFELHARFDPRVRIRAHPRAAVLTALTIGLVAGYLTWGRRG